MSEIDHRTKWLHEVLEPYVTTGRSASGTTKLSVSLPDDLVKIVRETAKESGLSVSATIAASLRRNLMVSEQDRLDAALRLDADEDRAWAAATAETHAKLVGTLEW
jgi:hypothetical protein